MHADSHIPVPTVPVAETTARPLAPASLEHTPGSEPLYLSPVKAGFPSPAEDTVDRPLDLHTHLVQNSAATFFLIASGDSMRGAGIFDGDLLIVDRSLSAEHGRVVIAAVDGELTVKWLELRGGRIWLAPANPEYPALDITEHEHIHIWGVVTYVVHRL